MKLVFWSLRSNSIVRLSVLYCIKLSTVSVVDREHGLCNRQIRFLKPLFYIIVLKILFAFRTNLKVTLIFIWQKVQNSTCNFTLETHTSSHNRFVYFHEMKNGSHNLILIHITYASNKFCYIPFLCTNIMLPKKYRSSIVKMFIYECLCKRTIVFKLFTNITALLYNIEL